MSLTAEQIQFKSTPVKPTNDKITIPIGGGFGANRGYEIHGGLDIAVPIGTPVFAVNDGRVVISRQIGKPGTNSDCGLGYIIEHGTWSLLGNGNTFTPDGYFTQYCHMSQIYLNSGDKVRAGEQIGLSGNTGHVDKSHGDGAHLHFQLKVNGTLIDPEPYIRKSDSLSNELTFVKPTVKIQNDYVGNITPYIASLESFHPKIQYELTRRRYSSETANTYIPFVKLTSLMKVKSSNLPTDVQAANYPSLGLHGQSNVSFDDIYSSQNNKSIVGYAIETTTNKSVPILVENSEKDPIGIPMPGITSLNVERNTAGAMGVRGGLMRATIKISAYSVGQANTLLRYFLRPSTKVILELGNKSSSPQQNEITTFNWNQPSDIIKTKFNNLITLKQSQSDFIRENVYNNFGNYEIFIGYVVKFNLKINKDNFYDIELTVHSVQQFEIPNKLSGMPANCDSLLNRILQNRVQDISDFFDPSQGYKTQTLTKLMEEVKTVGGNLSQWDSHVVKITDPNEDTIFSSGPKATGGTSTGIGGYYITWRFFIEVLLNNEQYGLMSLFPDSPNVRNFIKSGLIPTHTTIWGDTPKEKLINGSRLDNLISNEVGYHPSLRSTDPSVMVIVNKIANSLPRQQQQKKSVIFIENSNGIVAQAVDLVQKKSNNTLDALLNNHPGKGFETGAETPDKPGSSFLQNGVWINTNAIVSSFTNTDTVSSAISSLLMKMNNATNSYWNLQLLSNDTRAVGLHVIDYGLSKNNPKQKDKNLDITIIADPLQSNTLNPSIFGEGDTPSSIYVFNKKLRPSGDSIGGELLNMNIEFNLPTVIAVQVLAGVGGVAEKGTLQSLDIKELQELSIIDTIAPCIEQTPPKVSTNNTPPPPSQPKTQFEIMQAKAAELHIAVKPDNVTVPNPTPVVSPALKSSISSLLDFGTALYDIELDPSEMLYELNKDSKSGETNSDDIPTAHAFNSSNLTKTVVDLTLPGIGGIELFQSFLVDRVPSILDRGFYVVTKVSHEFSINSGWITKLTGRFRFYPNKSNTNIK